MIKIPIPKPVVNRSGQKFLSDGGARHLQGRSPHHFSVRDDDSSPWIVRGLILMLTAVVGGFVALSVASYMQDSEFVPEPEVAISTESVLVQPSDRKDESAGLESALKDNASRLVRMENRLQQAQASTQALESELVDSHRAQQQQQATEDLLREQVNSMDNQMKAMSEVTAVPPPTKVIDDKIDISLQDLIISETDKDGQYRFKLVLQGASVKGLSNRLRLVILPDQERDNKWTYVPANAWKRSKGYKIELDKQGQQVLEGKFKLADEFQPNAVRIEIYGQNLRGFDRLLRLRKPWEKVLQTDQ